MQINRRRFAQSLLLASGAGIVGIPRISSAAAAAADVRATLLMDVATGKTLHRSGACATRFAPNSTFKIPLALMGFDAGILKGTHSPAWEFDPAYEAYRSEERQRTDPTSWEKNSVIWYSREITRRLGAARFAEYVNRFGYGNRDVRGTPGKNDGLVNAWLGTSLNISADEQVAFLLRMLRHKLVSAHAHTLSEAILPVFDGSGGWQIHGKTGSGWMPDGKGGVDRTRPLGWFVGWADKGARRVAFARFMGGGYDGPGGLTCRKWMMAEIGKLAG